MVGFGALCVKLNSLNDVLGFVNNFLEMNFASLRLSFSGHALAGVTLSGLSFYFDNELQ